MLRARVLASSRYQVPSWLTSHYSEFLSQKEIGSDKKGFRERSGDVDADFGSGDDDDGRPVCWLRCLAPSSSSRLAPWGRTGRRRRRRRCVKRSALLSREQDDDVDDVDADAQWIANRER